MSQAVQTRLAAAQTALTTAQANLDSLNAQAASAQQAVDKARDDLAVWTELDANVDAEEAAKAPQSAFAAANSAAIQSYGTPEPQTDTSLDIPSVPVDDTPQDAPVEQAQ